MAQLDKFSTLKAIKEKQKIPQVPYSLWKHFIEADKTPEGLARAQVDFQRRYNSLFMKISPHGSYCVVDFGGILGGYRPISGSRICERMPILSLSDWETVEPVDPNAGEFGAQIQAVKLIHQEIENEVPSVMTVFSPFMVASKLDPNLLEHLNQDRKLILEQISMLTELMGEFAKSSLETGADGIFLATQHFNANLKPQDLREFEFTPMSKILQKVYPKSIFNLLHLHGETPYFRLASELSNIHAINWHDQTTSPSLLEARQDFTGVLVGGLDEMGLLREGIKEEISEMIRTVYRSFDDRGLIFAPGCVLPQDVTDGTLKVVVDIISSFQPV